MFADYDLGKGCIIGLVTGDGKETLYNTEETSVFTNTSFYNKAVEGESKSGNSFENTMEKTISIYTKSGRYQCYNLCFDTKPQF